MTIRRTNLSVAALVAGTLALGACGGQAPPDDDARATVSPADRAEDLRKLGLQDLGPTSGIEVPPDDLSPKGDEPDAGAPTDGQPSGPAQPSDRFARHAE